MKNKELIKFLESETTKELFIKINSGKFFFIDYTDGSNLSFVYYNEIDRNKDFDSLV